jgi:hypothetical protein
MPAVQFWLLHAGMAGAAALVFLVVKPVFGGLLKAPVR